MSVVSDFVTKVVLPPLIAAATPILEAWLDKLADRLEATAAKVLAEKLDELVPDSIDKGIPKILDAMGALVPKLITDFTNIIPNTIGAAFSKLQIPGINLGGFHL